MKLIKHFLNGEQFTGQNSNIVEVYNPATGAVSAEVALASQQETEEAIRIAAEALPAWSTTPPLKRARVMFKFKELLEANLDTLAAMITSEHGKVLSDAKGEIARGLEVVEVVPSQASEEIAAINKNRDEIGSSNNKRKNQHFSILISSLSRSFCRHNDDQEERSA